MSAPPPPQPPDSRTAAPTSPRLLPLPSSQWHVPFPAQLRSLLLFHCLFFPNPPPSLPLKKIKNPHPLLLSNSNPHHLASRRSPPPPLPVDPRGGFDKSRVAVRCGAPSRPVACKKVSGVFWKLRCDAPATARKGLQVCDTGVILLVGWGFAFWSRGGLGGRHGLGPQHGFQVWAW
uniref:Uncharacterized protein n=1 Tax=Oryza barthii TaxID=65489 RepID=A0A0D3FDB3_9ORYZ